MDSISSILNSRRDLLRERLSSWPALREVGRRLKVGANCVWPLARRHRKTRLIVPERENRVDCSASCDAQSSRDSIRESNRMARLTRESFW